MKKEKLSHGGKDVEKLEPSYAANKSVKWCGHPGEQVRSAQNSWTSDLAILLLRLYLWYYYQGWEEHDRFTFTERLLYR